MLRKSLSSLLDQGLSLTVRFQNWSLQLTLKITRSLAKSKVAIKLCSKLASFVSRFQDWVNLSTISCFDLLSFWIWLRLIKTEKASTWKVKSLPWAWNHSPVTSQHENHLYLFYMFGLFTMVFSFHEIMVQFFSNQPDSTSFPYWTKLRVGGDKVIGRHTGM